MKTKTKNLIIGILILISINVKCQQTDANQRLTLRGIVLPQGSTLQVNGNDISFNLPEGNFLILKDPITGNVQRQRAGTVTCKCNAGSGCNPFIAGGNYGCVTKSCTDCDMTSSGMDIVGVVNLNNPMDFVTQKDDISTINGAFSELFQMPEYLTEIVNNYDVIYGADADLIKNGNIPSDYDYYYVKIFDNLVVMPLKRGNLLNNSNLRLAGSITCKCTSGTSGCTADSYLAVKYCDAGSCTTCKLTTNAKVSSGTGTQANNVDIQISPNPSSDNIVSIIIDLKSTITTPKNYSLEFMNVNSNSSVFTAPITINNQNSTLNITIPSNIKGIVRVSLTDEHNLNVASKLLLLTN